MEALLVGDVLGLVPLPVGAQVCVRALEFIDIHVEHVNSVKSILNWTSTDNNVKFFDLMIGTESLILRNNVKFVSKVRALLSAPTVPC